LSTDVRGVDALAEAFETRRVESLIFHPGATHEDLLGLAQVLSLRPSPDLDVEAELAARHVVSVTVSVLTKNEEAEERDRQRQADRMMYQRAIAALRRVQRRLAEGGGDIGETGSLVSSVMTRLLNDPSAVLGLATMRGSTERDLFHSLNVMIYTLALGNRLELPEEGLLSVGLAGLMHDVGKTAFDGEDPSQVGPMRELHPRFGAEILQRVALEDPSPMLVAYEHHMHNDGGGWPERPDGYHSHPFSRMVAIADRYENLTNPASPGSRALTPDKAIIQVLREGGTILDPFFVRLFASALGAFPVGCLVRLSDHSVGVVCRTCDDPLSPVVRISYDSGGLEITDPAELDLGTCEMHIVEVIHPTALQVDVADKL
jgi:HD-GYP domain-containing protein (c-di-GMP phosphodiesterase class II)